MENASRAFLDAARKSMRQIRTAIGAATVNSALLAAAECLQYEGYLRREEANAAILAHAKIGASIKEIARNTGHSRGLVHKVLRAKGRTCFERAKVRLTLIFRGLTPSGLWAFAMAVNFGGVSRTKASLNWR